MSGVCDVCQSNPCICPVPTGPADEHARGESLATDSGVRLQTFREMFELAISRHASQRALPGLRQFTYYMAEAGLELVEEIGRLRHQLVVMDHELSGANGDLAGIRELFDCSTLHDILEVVKTLQEEWHHYVSETTRLTADLARAVERLDAVTAELAAARESSAGLREQLALSAGREEIYRVAIEHIWDEDVPPDYDEYDTHDDQAPSTGCIWAWHALSDADELMVRMGLAPDFEHQRTLHRERIMSRHNYRIARWPFPAPQEVRP